MDLLIFILGIFIFFGAFIYLIVSLIKKSFSKKWFLGLFTTGIVMLFTGLFMDGGSSDVAATKENGSEQKEVATNSEEKEESKKDNSKEEPKQQEIKEQPKPEEKKESNPKPSKTQPTVSESEESAAKETKAEVEKKTESDEKDKIENFVKKIIQDDFNDTKVSQLMINENLGLDDGSYIVLPHLKWDVQNSKKTTRDMLEMYSDHLAAKLADYNVSEVTVFWEVPYHLEGNNSAKFNYQRQGEGMAIGERWYAPVLQ